jgi:hypothetical protein
MCLLCDICSLFACRKSAPAVLLSVSTSVVRRKAFQRLDALQVPLHVQVRDSTFSVLNWN